MDRAQPIPCPPATEDTPKPFLCSCCQSVCRSRVSKADTCSCADTLRGNQGCGAQGLSVALASSPHDRACGRNPPRRRHAWYRPCRAVSSGLLSHEFAELRNRCGAATLRARALPKRQRCRAKPRFLSTQLVADG